MWREVGSQQHDVATTREVAMSQEEVLRPAEVARPLGVRTLVVVEAMYGKRVPRVRLPDGTLGVPADSSHLIDVRSA